MTGRWPEQATYDVVYALHGGRWEGRCGALDIAVVEKTRELAREALKAQARELLSGDDPLPPGCDSADQVFSEQLLVTRPFRRAIANLRGGVLPLRGPYVTDDDRRLVRRSVVTVIDELGTTERWCEHFDVEVVERRRQQVDECMQWLAPPVAGNLESVVSYTDNLIHASPVDSDDANALMYALAGPARYQQELALHGVLIRGGVAIGDHHASPGLLAGPALIEAHAIESKISKTPRIVLSDGAVDAARAGIFGRASAAEPQILNHLLLQDADGLVFVDYLRVLHSYDNGDSIDQTTAFLAAHRNALIQGLERYSGEVFESKWVWAAEYHNFTVRGLDCDSDLLISVETRLDAGHEFRRLNDTEA